MNFTKKLSKDLFKNIQCRYLQTSSILYYDQSWREKKRLEKNPNRYGPLTHAKDFSYLDGRPTPLNPGAIKRYQKQKEFAEKIITHLKEIDHAIKRQETLSSAKENERKNIKQNKLKSKRHLELKD